MQRDISEVKNWMHMFRWIVKLIRDDYGVGEEKLNRTAEIETDIGLTIEQREEVLEAIAQSFGIVFVDGTLDELVRFEELCLLSAWLHGLYKRPEFIGDAYAGSASAINPRAQMG